MFCGKVEEGKDIYNTKKAPRAESNKTHPSLQKYMKFLNKQIL